MLKGRAVIEKPMLPIPNINQDYAYDPTDIVLFDGKRVKRDSPLGQMLASQYPMENPIRQAVPIFAGAQDADYYLPMNKGLDPIHAAPGVTALNKLDAALEGSRTSTIRKDRQGLTVARQAQPGQTIRFFNDFGETGLFRVTETPEKVNQEIFQVDIPTEIMTPEREALIQLGLTEGQNELGIKRTLFGNQGNTGIGGSGSVIRYEAIPGTAVDISQLPSNQQQRIKELQSKQSPITDGTGYVGYKDNRFDYRLNPTDPDQGEMPMLRGSDQYDPVITGWLNANMVNEDSKYLTPAQIATRQARKSRYENGQLVERPITQAIQNRNPEFNQQSFDRALAMGDDLSRFYQPAVTQEMLDADLPRTNQLLTEDQAIRQIDRESRNQLASRSLESIELYNKPQDLRPPSNARGADNYNLAYKYTNTSDLLNLNDGYNQQWGEQVPKHYSEYAGGPIQYNDAGVAVGFGDRNLKPVTPLARGARNYLPVSETYTSAPQHTYMEQRNVVPLPPEFISSLQEQQQLRDSLPPEPLPLGTGTMNDRPVQTTGLTVNESIRNLSPSEALNKFLNQQIIDDGDAIKVAKSLTPYDNQVITQAGYTKDQVINGLQLEDLEQLQSYSKKPLPISNAYLQHVDEMGNVLIDPETKKLKVTPYIPSENLNQRSDELSRVLIQQGDRMYPYVGVAREPLMSQDYSENEAGNLVQKVSNTELIRDPSLLPDALNRIQDLKEQARILSSNTQRQGSTDTRDYLNKYLDVQSQAEELQRSYDALTAIDPDMNIDSQSFKVGVKLQQGESLDKITSLLRSNGIEPVIDEQEITGRGDLPLEQQVKLNRDIRRSLLPEVEQAIVSADPEMDELVKQWKNQRDTVRLNEIGRPIIDKKQVAINRLTNAIENANYEGEPVRQNLNFDPSDFDILSETVHPLDQIPTNNFQSQMAEANPGFTFTPSNSDPVYTGFQREPAGKMVTAAYLGEMLDSIPQSYSSASPSYSTFDGEVMTRALPQGEYRPMPDTEPMFRGKRVTVTPTPYEAPINPGMGMGRKALIGGGILGALALGGLAYQNAKRQQDEQDAYEMQMRQMTGWR